MPIIRNEESPRFEMPHLVVHGLASPRRGATETCVWRLALAPGAPPVPHSVTREEIFVATAGAAEVSLGGAVSTLRAGDALVVPAGVEFSLSNASSVPFEAVVALPVGGKALLASGELCPPWTE
jgi:quercetin dioxygenase-like cupin family protein